MDILFVFTSNLFFLWVIRDIFYWVNVWQENEYRPDRFFASVRRIRHKRNYLYWALGLSKWLLFASYGIVLFNDDYSKFFDFTVIVLYILQVLLIGRELYLNQLKKPKLTLRVYLTIFLTFVGAFLLFALPLMEKYFWLLIIDLFVPFLVTFIVFLFLFPIELYTDWELDHALKKLRQNPDLLVIAITGSYGKSITKDYIAHILEKKFRVIKTDGKDNTMDGIGRTILKKLESDTEIFVAELSAYQKGEIAMLCEFLHPTIGVLTSINNHYLSLFKSLDNILKTNYELVESLPKDGFCMFNGVSRNTYGLYKKSRRKKVLFSYVNGDNRKHNSGTAILAFDASQKSKQTTFTVSLKNKEIHFSIPPHHTIESILPAIYIADYLGMNEREIKRAISTI